MDAARRPRQCAVQILLVEHLAAADHGAIDCVDVDHSPLDTEAFPTRARRYMGHGRSEVAEAMHCLHMNTQIGRRIPCGIDV